MESIEIVTLANEHLEDIADFMDNIAREFDEPISNPSATKVRELDLLPTEHFWVALHHGKAVGTIGLSEISNKSIVLKRMFLASDSRGKGIAQLLLNRLFKWAEKQGIMNIYLGTMAQFKAAHKFYERNDFSRIEKSNLPPDFIINPVDSIFYQKILEHENWKQ